MPLWLPPRPPQFRKRVTPDANVDVTNNRHCSGSPPAAMVCNRLQWFAMLCKGLQTWHEQGSCGQSGSSAHDPASCADPSAALASTPPTG